MHIPSEGSLSCHVCVLWGWEWALANQDCDKTPLKETMKESRKFNLMKAMKNINIIFFNSVRAFLTLEQGFNLWVNHFGGLTTLSQGLPETIGKQR